MGGGGSISSSKTGAATFTGININSFVGATTFYSAGYTGTSSTIANVEGGLIWNGHSTLGHVTTDISAPASTPEFDWHATEVGFVLGGHLPEGLGYTPGYDTGISYNSKLESGSIAVTYPTTNNGIYYGQDLFGYTNGAAAYAYYNTMTNASGNRANVVNSSWNGGSDTTGAGTLDRFVDALTYQQGTAVVVSAGNSGYGNNRITDLAAAFNTITVGSTGSDINAPFYSAVSSFSSGGPSNYADNTGTVKGVRARVDLVAPGQDLTVAYYDGPTGSNKGLTQTQRDPAPYIVQSPSPNGTSTLYDQREDGTSYSAPIVAGGASLLVDAGQTLYGGITGATDGRLLKAILMNSAAKLVGFKNGSTIDPLTGALVTTQALDYSQGAGQVNLAAAYGQYTSGDHGIALTAGSGNIGAVGWDYNSVSRGASNDYFFTSPLNGGSAMTATLDWFMGGSYTYSQANANSQPTISAAANRLENLDLNLYQVVSLGVYNLVSSSSAAYITTQQIFFSLPNSGSYMLQVMDVGAQYDTGTIPGPTSYALAWSDTGATNSLAPTSSAAAPEPGSLALLLLPLTAGGGLLTSRRRRAR